MLILTFDEATNIRRTLDALKDVPEVFILDSGSSDGTQAIAASYLNVRLLSRSFDSHSVQWNYGLAQCGLTQEWVWALDADYVVTPELLDEVASLVPRLETSGYRTNFRYCVQGRTLSASLYPPVITLFRRERANYVQDGHTQRLIVQGEVDQLNAFILHDDRKPLSRWLASQDRYANLECDLLLGKPWRKLKWRDRLRRMVIITPWLVPLYCLFVGRGLFDGQAGLLYALQRGVAEAILSIKLLEARWRCRASGQKN